MEMLMTHGSSNDPETITYTDPPQITTTRTFVWGIFQFATPTHTQAHGWFVISRLVAVLEAVAACVLAVLLMLPSVVMPRTTPSVGPTGSVAVIAGLLGVLLLLVAALAAYFMARHAVNQDTGMINITIGHIGALMCALCAMIVSGATALSTATTAEYPTSLIMTMIGTAALCTGAVVTLFSAIVTIIPIFLSHKLSTFCDGIDTTSVL
jgi:hypothetical protein